MSTLDDLAADLAFAAGEGASKLRAELTHGAQVQSEIGVRLPGSGLISKHGAGHAAQRSAAATASNPVALANKMAAKAAEGGVELIAKGKR